MKSSRFRSPASSLEPLEARIAPAIIITGVPNQLPGGNADTDYVDRTGPTPLRAFVNTELLAGQSDAIAEAVGPGVVGVADTFYLRLSKGDILRVYNTVNGPEDYLEVKAGNVVAFFVDKDMDNEVDPGELVSLSLGKNASVVLRGGLDGSIIANLNENGTKRLSDDTIGDGAGTTNGFGGLVSATQNIKRLQIGANVGGSIIAGGSIGNVKVSGSVQSILTGSAAVGSTFEIFPGIASSGATIGFTQPAGVAGAGIFTVTVDEVNRIQAGDGGAGAAGGSLEFIQTTEDADGMLLLAGNGGASDAANKTGGRGGSVKQVYIAGTGDLSLNDLVQVSAGDGGASQGRQGGAGGTVSKIFVGFQLAGTKVFPSGSLLQDNVLIEAGEGGDGKQGGNGGNVGKTRVLVSVPDAMNLPGVNPEEIRVLAGLGGDNIVLARGKTGSGGSITNVRVENRAPTPGAGILIDAGDGGNSAGAAVGADGGSITKLNLLGTNLKVLAGDGSAGKNGGDGGNLTRINVIEGANVLARNATFNAGFGGDGLGGSGGNGGKIDALTVRNGDFASLSINEGAAANGGNGARGPGGKGGTVTDVDIFDGRLSAGTQGTLLVRGGVGGNGFNGGGNGGFVTELKIVSVDMNVMVDSGDGGSTVRGDGGKGGRASTLEVLAEGNFGPNPVTAEVSGGTGGTGKSGGLGGSISNASLRVQGNGTLAAGDGGNATVRAGGVGGSIRNSGTFATAGIGQLLAGDAGALGEIGADGGSIIGTASNLTGLYAAKELTVRAGNGSNGGDGGDIKFVGYGSTSSTLVPTPRGNILVQAGNGSAGETTAGRGGDIQNVSGAVSSLQGATTYINAGDGGASSTKSARGGSINDLVIERGGAENVELRIRAGDAGDASNGKTGSRGGSVNRVSIFGIADETILRSIAAGDGGEARRDGGNGGSISGVRVLGHEIGIRTGQDFGYDSMGGLFAGAGGEGGRSDGRAGNVKNVSADAIASIVAGKSLTPDAVNIVDSVTVNGLNLLKDSTGALLRGFQDAFVEYTYAGEKTAQLSPKASAQEVAAALNSLSSVQSAGGVSVTGNGFLGYTVTFNTNGDKAQILGEQTFDIPASEVRSGTFPIATVEERTGDDAPPAQEVQSFIIDPTANFSVAFEFDIDRPRDGVPEYAETPQLPPTTTAEELQDALNALVTIDATNVGPQPAVTVILDPATNKFVVTFVEPANYPQLIVMGHRPEVQKVDIFNTGEFVLEFDGDSTPRLPANASQEQVEAALNALPSVKETGPGNTGSVSVITLPQRGYQVTFKARGDQPEITATQFAPVEASSPNEGTADTREVQTLQGLNPVLLNPAAVANGNFVGAFADIQSFSGPNFRFIDTNGSGVFDLGDQPIDGLIIAKFLNQDTLNFTPEARLVGGVFYDFNNRI